MVPFIGAGILVIEKGFALAGLSSKHKVFTGIGGKPEQDEDALGTALREAVEELLDIDPNPLLIFDLRMTFFEYKMVEREGYHMLVFSFEDMATFLRTCKLYIAESPIYKVFPECAVKLCLDRIPNDDLEVTELAFINYNYPTHRVDSDFIKDCLFVETKCLCPTKNQVQLGPAQPGAT